MSNLQHGHFTLVLFVITAFCLSSHFTTCSPASIRHSQLGNKLSKNVVKSKASSQAGHAQNYLPTAPVEENSSVVVEKSVTKENSTHSSHFPNSVEEILRHLVTDSNAVEHLEKMKSKLLNQFQNKTGDLATGRGGYGGYGAYGFPSLEGALLSLAFLTFSVFLIDLIQQLLSRFRTGTAGVVPLVGRRKRSFVPEDEYDPISYLTASVLKADSHLTE